MYKNILVAIDPAHGPEQEAALHVATQLADDAQSTLTALTVVEPIPPILVADMDKSYVEKAGTAALAHLQKLVGQRSEVGAIIRHGKAGTEIVEYAKANAIDCIVLASHKPGLSDYFLGSTAARVVRHAPCSVHVMR